MRTLLRRIRARVIYEWEGVVLQILRAKAVRAGYALIRNDWDEAAAYCGYPHESLVERRFYNIGAGQFSHPFWTNIDLVSDFYKANSQLIGICFDLNSNGPIPVKSGTAEIVYSSHTMEHITNEAAMNCFKQAYRMLKRGGTFRLTTPDIDLEYSAWKAGDRAFFRWASFEGYPAPTKQFPGTLPSYVDSTISQVLLCHFATAAAVRTQDGAETRITDEEFVRTFSTLPFESALDYCTAKCSDEVSRRHPEYHRNWWNWTKLERMLREAGFENIWRSGFGQSKCPPLRNLNFFDFNSPEHSIYVEALK